jgi:hypothetical protein
MDLVMVISEMFRQTIKFWLNGWDPTRVCYFKSIDPKVF